MGEGHQAPPAPVQCGMVSPSQVDLKPHWLRLQSACRHDIVCQAAPVDRHEPPRLSAPVVHAATTCSDQRAVQLPGRPRRTPVLRPASQWRSYHWALRNAANTESVMSSVGGQHEDPPDASLLEDPAWRGDRRPTWSITMRAATR